MLIRRRRIERLSSDIRRIIDGQNIDVRDNHEGVWSILKNDVFTLAMQRQEQVDALERERDLLKDALADISHQIKTPLASMRLMTDLLENAPEYKRSEFIANIRLSLNRTEWLVSALLKMAKLDAGAIVFAPAAISSAALVELAAEPLQVLLDMKSQRIETGGEAELFCDKRWTAEALTNILKNAAESAPNGERLIVQAGANPICAWIGVTNTGKGISKSEIANLFKRFRGSQNDAGYGIGLPLALAIMRSQNGDIEVGSSGNAATFTLKFYK